ncbi:MAG: radical SAM protein, partial [Pseudomonadota bacterium]
ARIVGTIDDADEIIINTCIVKSPTENKIMFRIREIHREFPAKKIIIAGCLAKTDRVPEFCEKMNTIDVEKVCAPLVHKNPALDIIQISRGCISNCAYCTTKKARGALISSPPEKIIQRMNESLSAGIREFRFTSQDCGCYGLDIGTNLVGLLREVLKGLDVDFKIRIGMMNPTHLKEFYKELFEVYKDPRIVKFLHLPVQSGSDEVLKNMGRGYTAADFAEIIKEARRQIQGIIIWTDIIVGFPEETDSDFEKSCELLREVHPDFINVSKFGVRPGTAAARMKQLPTQVIKERSVKMSEIARGLRS